MTANVPNFVKEYSAINAANAVTCSAREIHKDCAMPNRAGIERMRRATEALMTASQSFSQKLYESAAQDGGAAGAASAPNDDDVVDAEIVDEGRAS